MNEKETGKGQSLKKMFSFILVYDLTLSLKLFSALGQVLFYHRSSSIHLVHLKLQITMTMSPKKLFCDHSDVR